MATAVSADEYKSKYETLVLEKNQLELQFGHKRAQFRQLYLDVEEKLKGQKEIRTQLEIQLTDLTKKNYDLKSEIEGVRIAAQLNNEDQISAMKTDHQEEIASLQHIYQEHAKENQGRLARQFEDERNKLIETIKTLEQKLREHEEVTKSAVATAAHPSPPQQHSQTGLMSSLSSAFGKKGSNTSGGGATSAQLLQRANSPQQPQQQQEASKDVHMDVSQQQVQKDVNAWKSIVAPLEKELQSLKQQLEAAKAETVPASNDPELQELKKVIECERSARTDLEMYVAVLNTQKGVLQEDTDKLKRELHNVCRLYEQEKMSHGELKQTWKMANEQFLDQQTKMIFELDHTKQLLTPQQLEHVSKEVRQSRAQNPPPEPTPPGDQEGGSSKIDMVADFDPLQSKKSQKSTETLAQQALRSSPSLPQKQGISESIFNALFPAASQARHFNEYMQDMATAEKPLVMSSSSESDSDISDINEAIRTQNKKRYHNIMVDEATEEIEGGGHGGGPAQSSPRQNEHNATSNEPVSEKKQSLKKSNSSGDILSPNISELSLHEKSLSHGDVSCVPSTSAHQTFVDEVDSKLSLNETGWSPMPEDYYSHACMMCQNYEKQLQRLQKELVAVQEKEKMLIDNVKTLQENLTAEKDKLISLEKSIESTDVDTKSQISIYQNNQQEVDKQVQLLHLKFQNFQNDIVKEIKSLSEERDRVLAEATQNQDTSGELTTEKEEELETEIMFLKDRMMAEQVDREAIEGVLQQDLKDARNEITHLHKAIDKMKTEEPDEPLLSL